MSRASRAPATAPPSATEPVGPARGGGARRTASNARPQRLHQAAAPIATRVDLHDPEPERAEPPGHGGEALFEPGDPRRLDFDAGALAGMAHAKRSEERRVGEECRSRWS